MAIEITTSIVDINSDGQPDDGVKKWTFSYPRGNKEGCEDVVSEILESFDVEYYEEEMGMPQLKEFWEMIFKVLESEDFSGHQEFKFSTLPFANYKDVGGRLIRVIAED